MRYFVGVSWVQTLRAWGRDTALVGSEPFHTPVPVGPCLGLPAMIQILTPGGTQPFLLLCSMYNVSRSLKLFCFEASSISCSTLLLECTILLAGVLQLVAHL